jgi:hypothetical protein
MTGFELTSETTDAHAKTLGGIAQTVYGAATAGEARVGLLDFGTLFATSLMPAVNAALAQVEEAVQRHGAELEQHRTDFVRTTAELTAQDESGAAGISRP